MEETFKVKTIGIRYICDFCKQGEVFYNGNNNWGTNPPKIEHACNNC